MRFGSTVRIILCCALLFQTGYCAPRIFGSVENLLDDSSTQSLGGNLQKTLTEIEAGLELVQLLPSGIVHRKLTDAVVVLSQALQNPNPILHSAVENAIRDATVHTDDKKSGVTQVLLSFLRSLKTEMADPRFPRQFSDWMKNQILMVENTLIQNDAKINTLAHSGLYGSDLRLFVDRLADKIANFNLFMQSGLEKLEEQPTLQFNMEIGALRQWFATGKLYQVCAAVVWDAITQDEPEPIDFLHALQNVYKRASPELQSVPQVVIRTIEIFLKTLPKGDYANFLEQLSAWSPSTALTPIPAGL